MGELIDKTLIDITKNILNRMGFDAEVEVFENNISGSTLKVISIKSSNNLSMLIGKNGQNIGCLEQIIKLLALKNIEDVSTKGGFMIDVNDYRKLRAKVILEQAKTTAKKVRVTQRAEALFPMSSYERRLVHMEFATCPDLETESVGEDPKRRIIIKPLLQ